MVYKKQLLYSNYLSFENEKVTYKKLYLVCRCLWIRNRDRREKWLEDYKCKWNIVLEMNVTNKMDRMVKIFKGRKKKDYFYKF